MGGSDVFAITDIPLWTAWVLSGESDKVPQAGYTRHHCSVTFREFNVSRNLDRQPGSRILGERALFAIRFHCPATAQAGRNYCWFTLCPLPLCSERSFAENPFPILLIYFRFFNAGIDLSLGVLLINWNLKDIYLLGGWISRNLPICCACVTGDSLSEQLDLSGP